MRSHPLASAALAALIGIAGCTTTISGPTTVADGSLRISVSTARTVPQVLAAEEHALAEARFHCWSAGKRLEVLSSDEEGSAGSLRRSVALRFVCTGKDNIAASVSARTH